MNSFLLINPLSGSYSRALHDEILSSLQGAGFFPECRTVTGPDDARRVCAEIEAASENPLVIVAGGDGTINAVINALSPGRATLAVLPVGTANVLALELGIGSVADGIGRIARGSTRKLSVGVLERAGFAAQRFVLMAGIGLDGDIVGGVRVREKRLLKKGAYLLSALRCLLKWPQGRFTLLADGHSVECHSVIVCNGSRYGGNLVLTPEANLFEPLLDLFCITTESRWSYLRIITAVMAGRPCRPGDVALLRAGQVQVEGERAIQLDGDYLGQFPVRISVVADFAGIIV
ncbi:MAG: diacylglycerol kinase family lipid kinase [Desulfuromonadales bacterium]|nr:diacylglycerol kinase family lipid kinase [Desulfuromonadales bacterium]